MNAHSSLELTIISIYNCTTLQKTIIVMYIKLIKNTPNRINQPCFLYIVVNSSIAISCKTLLNAFKRSFSASRRSNRYQHVSVIALPRHLLRVIPVVISGQSERRRVKSSGFSFPREVTHAHSNCDHQVCYLNTRFLQQSATTGNHASSNIHLE